MPTARSAMPPAISPPRPPRSPSRPTATKVYGAALPTFTATYTGFVNGDTSAKFTTQPKFSTTATSTSPVGTYAITAGGAADANYTISYVAGGLPSRPPRSPSRPTSEQGVRCGPAHLHRHLHGLRNGDTSASLTTQPKFSTIATAKSPVGTYTITVSGAVDANYTIRYVAGRLTVTQDTTTTTAKVSTTSSAMGQTVTITATVTATAPARALPRAASSSMTTRPASSWATWRFQAGRRSEHGRADAWFTFDCGHVFRRHEFPDQQRTASTITINQSIIVLDPTAGGALSIAGKADIKVTGDVYVDSSSANAFWPAGTPRLARLRSTFTVVSPRAATRRSAPRRRRGRRRWPIHWPHWRSRAPPG